MTNLFIVTSVIQPGIQKWSYTPVRSIFTPEQRFQQTLQTIDSIRFMCPNSKIMIVEGGPLTNEMLTLLMEKVDYFVDAFHTEHNTRTFCLESNNKGLGDAWLILQGLQYIKEHSISSSLIFKMSGRYRLNNQFSLERIMYDRPTFRRVSGAGCITFCFAVPGSMIDTYINIMLHTVEYFKTHFTSIEDYLPNQFSIIHEINCIGAEGEIAVSNPPHTYYV